MAHPNISQAKTIKIINNYLKYHNLPFKWNETGICNGLAAVHAQYVLQGKEDIFLKMLQKISSMSEGDFKASMNHDSPDEDLDHFISQVVLAYDPGLFDKKISQRDSFKALNIDSKPLDSDFILPLITSEENWASILKDMDLQKGEVLKINSPNHSISIHRLNGEYIAFDPNYQEGIKRFRTEEELMTELRTNVFRFQDKNMALTFTRITRSGFQHSSSFEQPKPEDYARKYLDVNAIASYSEKTINNATFIAAYGNEALMQLYFKKDKDLTASVLMELGYEAIRDNNNSETLGSIITQLNSCSETTIQERKDKKTAFRNLILLSILNGRQELFNKLIENDFGLNVFQHIDDSILMELASRGGDKELLIQILAKIKSSPCQGSIEESEDELTSEIEDTEEFDEETEETEEYDQKTEDVEELHLDEEDVQVGSLADFLGDDYIQTAEPEPSPLAKIILQKNKKGEDAIMLAIKGQSPDCLRVLFKQLKEEGYNLSEEKLQDYLELAICTNNVHMVDEIFHKKNSEEIKSLVDGISLSSEQVQKMNIHLLKTLERNGMVFDNNSQNIMTEKANQKMSHIEILGVKLVKFVEYIKSVFTFTCSPKEEDVANLGYPHKIKNAPCDNLTSKFNSFKQKHQEHTTEQESKKEAELDNTSPIIQAN
ncbi:hypothetical protein [Legionella wadsworthii]|uniref:hypothetical protein n=1 Tax=Legionella wadsworthii TaxID=28088 RepID=UPI001056D54C|nr:hypothetical protein [Legionella wadsworthii]